MVLVEHAATGMQVRAVEINPDIPLLQQADGDAVPQRHPIESGARRQVLDEPLANEAIGPWPSTSQADAAWDSVPPQTKERRKK